MPKCRYPLLLFFVLLLTACQGIKSPPTLAEEITFYDWESDLPIEVIQSFEQEFQVKVNYLTYATQEEALENLRRGKEYDLVVFDSRFVPALIQEKLIAQLDFENIPNFRFISPSFRDLVYDSGNRYSIPYSWGTVGLVVHTDLAEAPILSWGDLLDPGHPGKIALWRSEKRLVIGLVLKSLGYSANTENEAELDAAAQRLMQARLQMIFYEDYDESSITPAFLSGDVISGMGYASDYLEAKRDIDALEYILPQEGALLWGDTFVIPESSKEKYTAQVFLNYILKPDISATIVNFNHYATANQLAYGKIIPEIYGEPAIFPPQKNLNKAESILPLSKEAQENYDKIWLKFLTGAD